MVLDAFKKMWHLQTCTCGVVDGTSGISSPVSASARKLVPAVSRFLRIAEPKAMATMNRTAIGMINVLAG
jgi:hypothetical protein